MRGPVDGKWVCHVCGLKTEGVDEHLEHRLQCPPTKSDLHGYETCDECGSPRKGVHADFCSGHECDAELILKEAADGIRDRATTRDNEKEKSMTRTLRVFSQLVGHEPMPESEGWLFMACVKLGRSQQGGFHLDDYIDAAAYVALAGEAAAKESEYGRRKD